MASGIGESTWRRLLPLLLAVAAVVVYAVPAVDVPFYTKGEAREAVLVQAMLREGNFVLPMRNGTEIPTKPPLLHWLGAAVAKLGGHGVSEPAVRLPSILAAAFVIAMTARVGGRLFSPAAGTVAAVVLASSVTFFVSATAARVDMVLAASIAAALGAFALDYFGPRRGLAAAYHAAVATAVLAKGPVGAVLPWSVVLVMLGACRDGDYLRRLRPLQGLAWLAVPAAWYTAAYALAGDSFLSTQLLQENFQRVVDPEGGGTGHVKPFYAHVPLLLGGIAPWTLMLPVAIAYAVPESFSARSRPLLFLLLWLVVPFVLFSAAGSKRAVYLLPAYPATALLVSWWWTTDHGWTATAVARSRKLWTATSLATATLLCAAFSVVLAQAAGVPLAAIVAPFLSEGDRANLTAILRNLEHVRLDAVSFAAACLAAAVAFAISVLRGRRGAAVGFAGLLTAMVIAGGSVIFQKLVARSQSVAPFVSEMRHDAGAVPGWFFYRGVSYPLAFYADRPVPRVDAVENIPRQQQAVVFVESGEEEVLRAEAAEAGRKLRELGRFTYDDNPEREALLALLVTAADAAARTPVE